MVTGHQKCELVRTEHTQPHASAASWEGCPGAMPVPAPAWAGPAGPRPTGGYWWARGGRMGPYAGLCVRQQQEKCE